MKLDFGRVKTYRAAGFGFVTGFLSHEIFFRIEKITDKDVQDALKANEDCKSLSENVCFWYAIEKTDKGNRVKKVYRNVQDIPDDILFAFIDELHKPVVPTATSYTYYTRSDFFLKKKLNSQLFADTRVSDDKLQKFIDVFSENPIIVYFFIEENQNRKEFFKRNLENRWKDLNQPLPDEMDLVTYLLFESKQSNVLYLERQYAFTQEEERKKEALTRELFKHWKDATLSDEIKEDTLKKLGINQYNLLLSLRENYFLLSEGEYSRFIPIANFIFDVETGLMWLLLDETNWQHRLKAASCVIEARNAVKQARNEDSEEIYTEFTFTDWRLHSNEELQTLVGYTDSDIFPNSPFVENSEPPKNKGRSVWDLDWEIESDLKPKNSYVKLVRGQQNLIQPTSKSDIFEEGIITLLGYFNAVDIARKNAAQNLARKYRINPKGIRNDLKARKLCLKCGSSDNVEDYSPDKHYFQVCKTCGTEWYVNHCWKCHCQVDERDSETPKCKSCGWCRCTCGACEQGCRNNIR